MPRKPEPPPSPEEIFRRAVEADDFGVEDTPVEVELSREASDRIWRNIEAAIDADEALKRAAPLALDPGLGHDPGPTRH